MTFDPTYALILAATAADGLLAGASLDQSIKQLPARHRIGAIAFSAYSRAADLGPGILWYAILGISAAALTIGAAIAGLIARVSATQTALLIIAASLAIFHSLATTQAAPINFSQRRVANDEAALTRIFDRFARWQTVRVILQPLTFAVMFWALVVHASA